MSQITGTVTVEYIEINSPQIVVMNPEQRMKSITSNMDSCMQCVGTLKLAYEDELKFLEKEHPTCGHPECRCNIGKRITSLKRSIAKADEVLV